MRDTLFVDEPPNKKTKSSATSKISVSLAESSPAGPSTSDDLTFTTPFSSGSTTPCFVGTSDPALMGNDNFSHNTPDLTATPTVQISTPASTVKCKTCAQHSKKRRMLLKKHNRMQKRFAKLKEKLKLLQNVQVHYVLFH